jgi:hypothetical protein
MISDLTKATPWLLCAAVFAVNAQAQTATPESNTAKIIPGQIVVDQATQVVERVKQTAGMASLIDNAKAVLVVPRYGESQSAVINQANRAAPGDSTRSAVALTRNGDPGVFLVRGIASWSSPAFFSVAPSNGSEPRANGSEAHGMPIVMVFMTDKAADQFKTTGTFSLSGLDAVRYSGPRSRLADADVIVWTPADWSGQRWIASHEFHFDGAGSNAYYRNQVSLGDILSSTVGTDRSLGLQTALSTKVASQ